MMTTDPIADMLTRMRNALSARHAKVDVPASRLKNDIAKILKDEGYIANFKLTEDGTKKSIRIYLKYTPGNVPVISRIERVSRRDDGAGGAQAGRGRRSPVSRLVDGELRRGLGSVCLE
jgi:ribosomal protein S8